MFTSLKILQSGICEQDYLKLRVSWGPQEVPVSQPLKGLWGVGEICVKHSPEPSRESKQMLVDVNIIIILRINLNI